MPQNLTEGGHVTGSLVAVVITQLPIKYPEEIVVSATDNLSETEVKEMDFSYGLNKIQCPNYSTSITDGNLRKSVLLSLGAYEPWKGTPNSITMCCQLP